MYDTQGAVEEILQEAVSLGPAWHIKVVSSGAGIHYWYFWRRVDGTNTCLVLCRNSSGYAGYCSTDEQPAHNTDAFGKACIEGAHGPTAKVALIRMRAQLCATSRNLEYLARFAITGTR